MKYKNKDLLFTFAKNNNISVSLLKSKKRDYRTRGVRKKCCLELFNEEKLSVKEIASLLNRSVGTIYAILDYSKIKNKPKNLSQSKGIFIKKILDRKKELLKELKLIEDVLSGYDFPQQ